MITLVNPNLVLQREDMFTTGIVYMPVGLAYLAGALRSHGFECRVIDAFGEQPGRYRLDGRFMTRGLTPEQVCDRVDPESTAIVLYAINVTYHRALAAIAQALHRRFPAIPLVVMENTQAVTAYSLRQVQDELYGCGVSYVLTGEPEERGVRLMAALRDGGRPEAIAAIDGIGFRRDGCTHYSPPATRIADLDTVPFPAWDLFPLANYWKLGYAHGPFETTSYLPLLTSRGCPYLCRFCVIPETNGVKWRARSARNVVDEIEAHQRRFGVREFHIEDVDPTVNDTRTRDICRELLRRDLHIIWKIAAGTKVETLRDEETIALMAEAGCRYISISPESGSPRIMKAIDKPFDFKKAVRLIAKMNQVGIRSQACFVLGFPGETDEDRRMTWDLVRELTRVGVDEIVLSIVVPIPGSAIFDQFEGYDDYSDLTFSPSWRADYSALNAFRHRLYRQFLLWKLWYHPGKLARQPLNFLTRRFQTKMEMTPYRALRTTLMDVGLAGRRVRYES
jgi:anaerobic magnesium-protoporphyrin IX monomethyl ester cyclase